MSKENLITKDNAAVGERLRNWLIEKYDKLTIAAKALDMSDQTLNPYLRGARVPGNAVKNRLRELGCDVDWVMTGRKKDESPPIILNVQEHDKDTLIVELLNQVIESNKTNKEISKTNEEILIRLKALETKVEGKASGQTVP